MDPSEAPHPHTTHNTHTHVHTQSHTSLFGGNLSTPPHHTNPHNTAPLSLSLRLTFHISKIYSKPVVLALCEPHHPHLYINIAISIKSIYHSLLFPSHFASPFISIHHAAFCHPSLISLQSSTLISLFDPIPIRLTLVYHTTYPCMHVNE